MSTVESIARPRRNGERRRAPTASISRSEERFSRNAETDLVCRLLLEKKNKNKKIEIKILQYFIIFFLITPQTTISTLFPYTTLFRSSGINTILHELNPLFTINVTMRDIKSKNVYSRVNSKATTQWRKTESANGVHL